MKNIIFLSFIFLAACNNNFKSYNNPTVVTDKKELDKRVSSVDQSLEFVTLSEFTSSVPKFQHLVNIDSPMVGLNKLKATSILKLDNRILISYNTEGSAVAGGVDIVDVSNLLSPQLVGSWLSSDYEFNDLKSKGRALYLAGSKKNVGAVVVIMDIANMANPVVVNELLVPGDVATSIDVRGDRLLVSSALGGGISRYEVSFNDVLHPQFVQYNPFPNALFVKAMYNPYDLAQPKVEPLILGGNSDTHLYFMDKELPLSLSPSIAPSRFAVQGPFVFVNSSSGGLKISEVSKFYDGRGFEGFVSSLNLPGTGNGIAHSDQRLYLARGESGIRYIDIDEPGNPQEIGFFDFEDGSSSNNVWVERMAWTFKIIIVANGEGGTRIVLEDTTEFKNAGDWMKVYAKGTPLAGVNPLMKVYINGVDTYTAHVDSEHWKLYHINLPAPIPFGAEVKIAFVNDDAVIGVDDRNLSIGYVKIGDDYYYPWWNNYFLLNNSLALGPESDNLQLYWNGYIKLFR